MQWKKFSQMTLACVAGLASFNAGISYAQQAGTTLSVTKTATGFWERLIEYDWTVLKEVTPASITLGVGESTTVTYKITTTKTAKNPADTYGAKGQICVTNGGGVATEDLLIADNVQAKVGAGQFTTISTAPVDTSVKPVLGPGESYCYPYRVTFSRIASATYRNEAKVTITNHSGWIPVGNNCPGPALCPFGPQYRVGFTLPTTYTTVYKDAAATISDAFSALSNFSVTPSQTGPWTQTAAGTIQFTAIVTDNDATCNTPYTLLNTATLVESDTRQTSSDTAPLGITTKDCSSPLFSGCTFTIGYWTNHGPGDCHSGNNANEWPVTFLTLGNVSYTDTELCAILNESVGGNGLISLAHQLIGAKFNVANGASGGSLVNAITQADALIGNSVVPPTNGSTDVLST